MTIIKYNNILCFIAYANDINNINYKKNKIHQQSTITRLNQISDAHSQCLIQIQQQLSDNQHDIDTLHGYIQDIQHHISEITNNQKKTHQQLNLILNEHNNSCKHNNITYSTNPKKYNTINNSHHINNRISTTIVNNTNNMENAYKEAVALVLEKKQYNQAIQAFQCFIKNYPQSNYEANAHYWLGQLYYTKNNKNDASYHFALVAKNYPKSSKASDALLKIGIILQESHQIEESKTIYQQVGKLYPSSDAAKQAQKRLLHL